MIVYPCWHKRIENIDVEENKSSDAEAESGLLSIPNNTPIPILFENCNDAQDSDPSKKKRKVETDDINSNQDIVDPVDFRIDDVVAINVERYRDSIFLERVDINSNTESNENLKLVNSRYA